MLIATLYLSTRETFVLIGKPAIQNDKQMEVHRRILAIDRPY